MILKNVHQFVHIASLNLLIVLSGKQREILLKSVKLILNPSQSSVECRLIEAKNIISFAVRSSNSSSVLLCVAIKTQLILFQISSDSTHPLHYVKMSEMNLNGSISYLEMSSLKINSNEEYPMIWYGCLSTFFARRIGQNFAPIALFRESDLRLQIIRVIPLNNPKENLIELLLVYTEFGIYIDYSTGRRTRQDELMWPSTPKFTSFSDRFLSIFTDESIEIYDVHSGLWLQSLSLSKSRPLNADGSICLANDSELDRRHGILFHLTQSDRPALPLNIIERLSIETNSRRTSKSNENKRIPKIISTPVQCHHVFGLDKRKGHELMQSLTTENQPRSLSATLSTHRIEHYQTISNSFERSIRTATLNHHGNHS